MGRVTRFQYDELNRLIEQRLPGGQSARLTYDAMGNLVAATNFNGDTITYEYDERNRLVRKLLPDFSAIEYTYTATGQRQTVTDSRGVTSYTYDELDRLISVAQPGGTIRYTYDGNGNLTSIQSPSDTVSYSHNALGALTAVTSAAGTATFGYDVSGRQHTMTAVDGTVTEYGYNSRRHLTSIAHRATDGTLLASFTYELSPSGRREAVTELDGSVVDYSYDALDRLVGEVRTGTHPYTASYAYDLVGNRTRMVRDGVETLYTYDDNDRMLSAGDVTYTYDDNGSIVQMTDGATVVDYTYDAEGRLTGVSSGGTSTTFTYDADGNRVASSGPNGDVAYLVDKLNGTGYAQVLEERDGNGDLLAHYTYGTDLLSMDRDGVHSVYHYDGGLSTRLLTQGGAVTDRYTYDAFGNLMDASGSTANAYRYAGEQIDDATGLYYLRARYYDPSVGRFTSRDPFSGFPDDPMSLHKYLYAHTNPVNGVDPSGQYFTSLAGVMGTFAVRSAQVFQTVRRAQTLCQLQGSAKKVGKIMKIAQLFRSVSIDIGELIANGGTWQGQQGLWMFPYSAFEYTYEAPKKKIRTLNKTEANELKELKIKVANKYTGMNLQEREWWFELSAETQSGIKSGVEFPFLPQFRGEALTLAGGRTFWEKTGGECGLETWKVAVEGETKWTIGDTGNMGKGYFALVGKAALFGFLEFKTTLFRVSSDKPLGDEGFYGFLP